jgi:hypothetical protein
MGVGARAVVVASLVATACSHADTPTSTAASMASETARAQSVTVGSAPVAAVVQLDCGQSIATLSEPDLGTEVVLDVVALQTSAAAATALQTQDERATDPGVRLWAKSGLVVRGGAAFALEVPASHRDRLALGWGSPAPMARRVEVAGCGSTGQWLAFAGGFWGADVGCVPVDVVTGAARQTVTIGFGAPCPGQEPPPEPTDR